MFLKRLLSVTKKETVSNVSTKTAQTDNNMKDLLLSMLADYGLREVPGIHSNPKIIEFFDELGYDVDDDSLTAWCLSGDIEILTEHGFVRLDKAHEGSVAQLNTENHSIEWVNPVRWIAKDYVGEVYDINKSNINLTCDPNHQIYGRWSYSNKYFKKAIKDISLHGVDIPPINSGASGYNITDNDLILLAAYLSDGHKKYNRINFKISKPHKIEALNKLNYTWSRLDNKRYGNRKLLTLYSFVVPDVFKDILKGTKTLEWEFIKSLSQRQCKLFTDSYSLFDGTRTGKTKTLFTSDKELADSLCYIATMAGYRTTPFETKMVSKNCLIDKLFNIYISNNKHKRIRKNDIKKRHFEGKLYCVEVPSGVFIIKDRLGNILPTGNCSAAIAYYAKENGYEYNKSLLARDWLKYGEVVLQPSPGDVVVFWRDKPDSWKGHVGLFISQDVHNIYTLGGNQNNSISISPYPQERLLGYRRLKKTNLSTQ